MTKSRLVLLLAALAVVLVASHHFEYFGWPGQPALEKESVEWAAIPRDVGNREKWFWQQRAYPVGAIPVGARLRALEDSNLIRPTSLTPEGMVALNAQWTQLGPAGFDSTVEPTWGRQSGRTRALVVDPRNSARLFLGTASGGVWRSTDSGATWTPLTDNQDSLSIGSVAMDPQNSDTIYAGTGEGPSGVYYSVGILKSTDGGNTWTRLASSTFSRHSIAELLVSPTDSNVVLACASTGSHQPGGNIARDPAKTGIFRSTDGGVTFTQTQTGNCQDLIASPASFNNQFASLTGVAASGESGPADGIYHSTDGGQSWSQVTSDGAPSGSERLNIGISADGMTLYAGGKSGQQTTIWKSVDGGANWQALANAPDYCEKQCDYDNDVAVSPANANQAYFGGVPFFRTMDGGMTFEQLGASNDSQPRGILHVDHHILVFDPNDSNTLYVGNDGGLYRSTNISTAGDIANPGPTWTSLGGTLGTIQFYDLRLHPTDPEIMLGGVQDNGTEVRSAEKGAVWTERCGGDGTSSLIDHANPMIMYCSFAFTGGDRVGIQKSTDGGVTFPADVSLPKGMDRSGFVTPLAMDPTASTTLYAGTQRLYKSTDGGANWAPIGPDDLTSGDGTISALEIAPSNPMTIWVTTSDGLVQVSKDGGETFTNVTKAPLPGRFATGVAIHPTNPDTAYAGYSGFNDGTPATPGHIYRTTDGGNAWTDITGNLPDIPVNAIAVHPTNPTTVYAGTDIGVFVASIGAAANAFPADDLGTAGAAGVTWNKFTGLPNAGVIRVRVNATTNRIVVATYGRSVWSTPLTSQAQDTFFYLPIAQGDMHNFTGIAFTNTGEGNAQLSLEARAGNGNLQSYPTNPSPLPLEKGKQTARLARQFFGVDLANVLDGWIRVSSNAAGVASFFQLGNGLGGSTMTRLDGGVAFESQSQTMYFTRLYSGAGSFPAAGGALNAETQLSVANPNSAAITALFKLFDADGAQVGQDVTREINALGCLFESLSSLFGPAVISNGFVRVDITGPGAVGFELITLPDAILGLNASFGNAQSRAYSAQLAHGNSGGIQIFTSVKLVNVSGETRMVTITGLDEAGQSLGEKSVTLNPNQSFQADVGDTLGLGPVTGPAKAGSMRVQADGSGVIGDNVFGEANSVRFGAALALQTRLLSRAIFNHVANLNTGNLATSTFTGQAFHNPQTVAADITLSVFDAQGTPVGSRTVTLGPGNRISDVLASLIPATGNQAGGYIVITSTQPVVAQLLFGNLTLEYLSAVPPTIFN